MAAPTPLSLPLPPAVGLSQYPSYYPDQPEAIGAIMDAVQSGTPMVAISAPTGAGKSLMVAMAAALAGVRTVVLTETRALQDQYLRDYRRALQLQDIRGQTAYPCIIEDGITVADGPCHSGYRCEYREGGCTHYDALRVAQRASFTVSNYAYWFAGGDLSQGTGLLVLDEADGAWDSLSDHLSVSLSLGECRRLGVPDLPAGGSIEAIQWWAMEAAPYLVEQLAAAEALSKGRGPAEVPLSLRRRLRDLRQLQDSLAALCAMEGQWAAHWSSGPAPAPAAAVTLTPVWPVDYLERSLYRGVPTVVLLSATLPKHEVERLAGGRDYLYLDFPSHIPVQDRAVTPLRMTGMSRSRQQYGEWTAKLDNIVAARLDRKTIIHTTSYERARRYLAGSRWAAPGILIGHDNSPGALDRAVAEFRRREPPAVLVSPSLSRGFDFPGDECRCLVIAKLPYPSPSPLLDARKQADPDYLAYEAMKALIQEAGRAVRYVGDWCEVLVADGDAQWFWKRYSRLANQWFQEAWQDPAEVLPQPRPLAVGTPAERQMPMA